MSTSIHGILAAQDWNSNQWQQSSTKEDLENSYFGFDAEQGVSATDLNFGHEVYPADENGFYYGVLPQFNSKAPDRAKVKDVKIVFLKSKNWQDGETYLVGFYALPLFVKGLRASQQEGIELEAEHHVKALVKDIHLLQQPLQLNDNKHLKGFVPKSKDLGKQAINFLSREQVLKILDEISLVNPTDMKLKQIKFRMMKALGLAVIL
ncbi:MAG: hypothetical protein WC756_18470 [Taibaiella sp.]|jgi:hypothetical protein